MDKILIYAPMSPVTPKIYGRALTSIMRLGWPGQCDIVFGRNESLGGRHKYADICTKHNEARTMALTGNYAAVLFVENDMIVPSSALLDLNAVDADVAYGLYCSRHGFYRWLAFCAIEGLSGASFSQDPDLMRAVWGKACQTKGVGMGCTLVRRHVLEALEFRTHPEHAVADDWMFSLDCIEYGITQAHHFGVVCGHITNQGTTLWPDPEADGGYRVEFPPDAPVQRATGGNPLTFQVGMETKVIHGQFQGQSAHVPG